jgi:hypothetical protein
MLYFCISGCDELYLVAKMEQLKNELSAIFLAIFNRIPE